MKKRFILIALISFVWIAPTWANDTAFGGSGASPMPIEQSAVEMVDEHVVIEGVGLNREDYAGKWGVTCDFTFRNTSDKPVKIRMGFPFPLREDEGPVTIPHGKKASVGDPLVYDFKVTINGKPVHAVRQKISPNRDRGLYYSSAYLWDVEFKPGETLKIRNTYTTGVTFDVMGYSWASYVLKTGGMWKSGSIGNALIEVKPGTITKLCSEVEAGGYLKPKPEGMRSMGSGTAKKYVWKFRDYTPKDDLNICLQTGKNYVRYRYVFRLLQAAGDPDIDILKKSPAQLRILRNTIFAQYGRTFKDAKLQAHFDKQWWYKPNSAYNDSMLTEDDKKALAAIRRAEAR